MNYVITNNLSLKYQRFTSSDCKEGFEHFDLWERLNSVGGLSRFTIRIYLI